MDADARARISAAQKSRWSKAKKGHQMKLNWRGKTIEIPVVSNEDARKIEELARDNRADELEAQLKKLGVKPADAPPEGPGH